MPKNVKSLSVKRSIDISFLVRNFFLSTDIYLILLGDTFFCQIVTHKEA